MARILVADKISAEGINILKRTAQVDIRTALTKDELLASIGEYDALVVRSATQVTSDVIAAAKKLRIIGRAGVGVDSIDVPAATKQGIVVVNSPEGNMIAAAELTMAHLLALSRNIPAADQSVKRGEWERNRYIGVEVYNKILGVLGLGKIGREVAKRALAFGMRVIGYDPFLPAEAVKKLGVQLVDMEQLLRESDYITLHLPKNKETEGLIGSAEIRAMKDGVRIINVARGGIIDEAALTGALKDGKVAGAALDVYSSEPVSPDNPLLDMANTITTPHLGASTKEAQNRVAVDVAEQIIDYLRGKPVRAAVNMPVISPEVYDSIKPYLALAERMGSILTNTADGRIDSVNISYRGEVANEETGPITRAVLVGLLKPILSETVNFVNALVTAESRGIHVAESRSPSKGEYTSLILIDAITGKGNKQVGGTVFGKDYIHIVSLDGYRVDVVPEGTMLFAPHIDRPGVIGSVGSTLGSHGINIAGMSVGRMKRGSCAVMVMGVDSPIPDNVMHEIECIDGIENVKQVTF
ncbi:MAG: phosphoglycerate dehydrogenase [Armatimonadota bacterium]